MRAAFLALVLAGAAQLGCSNEWVQVRVEQPYGAKATILKGYDTPEIDTKTPFVGRFEAVSLDDADAYLVVFDLDAATAARYGGSGAIRLYGHLTVGPPTELAKTQTLILRMPDDKLHTLLTGLSSEVEAFVDDPTEGGVVLARLVMRARPF